MRLLGMEAEVLDILGSAAVVKVVRIRLRSADAVFEAIKR